MAGSTYGPAYVPVRDEARLTAQLGAIWDYIRDQHWFTLADVEGELGFPQASISAQLRHLRKPRFGGHRIIKRYIDNGLWEYQLHDHHAFSTIGQCVCGATPFQSQIQQRLF